MKLPRSKPRFWNLSLLTAVLVIGLALAALAGQAQAVETLYGIDFYNNHLFTINTTTGAGSLVGSLGTQMDAFGLGTRLNKLYAYDSQADRIQQLNPLTGATVNSINIGAGHIRGEGGIDFRSDGIGFLSRSNGGLGTLYSFNITVPSSTMITTVDGLNPSMDGLAFNGADVLYGLSQDTNNLYTIDQATGVTTFIGSTGVSDPFPTHLAGLAFRSDGTLFAAMSDELYILDPTTAAATLVGPINGFSNVCGLTFLNTGVVPIPGSVGLLGSGLFSLIGLGWWRKKSGSA